MKEQPLTYRFHLPFSGDLQPLLDQPYITVSILNDMLRRRGSFINCAEKQDYVAFLKISYLTPDEFDYLMELAIDREEKKKIRNDYDELKTETQVTLESALPSEDELNVSDLLQNRFPHCTLVGRPFLARKSNDHYYISYTIKRRNLHSNWLKSEQEFQGELHVIKDDQKGIVKTECWHTSEETRRANRIIASEIRKTMTAGGLIKENQTHTIRFNTFDNKSRIAFLMLFTGDFTSSGLVFDKLLDMSLSLDESCKCDDIRLAWMKEKVSKLNLSGTALHDTFFVTDLSCRDFLHVWRFECRYKFDKPDGRGSITIAFEFGGYSKSKSPNAPFQISCVSLSASKYKGAYNQLERIIIAELNAHQFEFAESVK